MNLVLCEPQCRGFEHSTFNAGLLQTVRNAYPGAKICFMAEPEHIDHVRQALRNRGLPDNHGWEELSVPKRLVSGRQRLPSEHRWVRDVLSRAHRLNAELLLLCSVADTGLLALKALMLLRRFHVPTLAVVHANLNALLHVRSLWPHRWLLDLRTVLNLPNPPSLRMVALGGPIYQLIMQAGLRTTSNWTFLDCPYLWPDMAGPYEGDASGRVRFGYLGVAGKGFELFSRLADETVPQFPNAEFHLVGFLPRDIESVPVSPYIQGLGKMPLSVEEFHRRARVLTYCVGTRSPDYYRLIASATFVDALAFQKPGIYLRNPYLDHYFGLMGDIGYLCRDYEEIRDTIHGILRDFPRERYQKQIVNILDGRAVFGIERAALRLRNIVENCQADLAAGHPRAGGAAG